jgi:hypothetical protein
MRALKHLPSIAFGLMAFAWLYWFFGFSITSFDLRPWLIAFLCTSWFVAFVLGWVASHLTPSRFRGITTGIITVAVGVLLFLAVGWPSAETVTSMLREMRGFQSDMGTTYFYHDFSGMGTGDLFNFYGKTLKTALVASAVSLFVALILCPIFGIPFLLVSSRNKEAQQAAS